MGTIRWPGEVCGQSDDQMKYGDNQMDQVKYACRQSDDQVKYVDNQMTR